MLANESGLNKKIAIKTLATKKEIKKISNKGRIRGRER